MKYLLAALIIFFGAFLYTLLTRAIDDVDAFGISSYNIHHGHNPIGWMKANSANYNRLARFVPHDIYTTTDMNHFRERLIINQQYLSRYRMLSMALIAGGLLNAIIIARGQYCKRNMNK